MLRKDFELLRPGDKVMFVKSGEKLNGKVVTISRIRGDEIIAPNPIFDNTLCAWKYTHFVRTERENVLPGACDVKLRIMTRKSIIGFGKFADMRVGDIMKVDPRWLVWAYGHFDKVTFTDEILEELGCRQIEKPGNDDNIVREWLGDQLNEMTPEERKKFWMLHNMGEKRSRLAKAHAANMSEGKLHSRSRLMAANHGHIKL